jgi:hypothetical protein
MGRCVVAGLMAASALTACAHDKGAAGEGPYADKVAEIVPKLEKETGLKFKTPPKLEIRTHDEVKSFLEQRFNDELPAEELSGSERAYKRLGLLPDSLDLRAFMLQLLTEQVIGYYDPKVKILYVVQGAGEENVVLTISHELVHALQDQYFNLDSLQNTHDDDDRSSAAQAVIEGQATLDGIAAMIGGQNFVTALPGGWDRIRQMIRESQGSMPVFASAPMLLQETLIFPYLSGAEFVRRFEDKERGKMPFDRMPTSTEQILHEDRYFGDGLDPPTAVTLPPPRTGKLVYSNDLGEFETRLLLFQYLRDQPTAVRGAAGWDGDRYQLISVGRNEALVWLSVWDTSIDAAEFFNDLDLGLLKHYASVKPETSTETRHAYLVGGRTMSIEISEIQKRPVVVFTDVPRGVSSSLLDLAKVTLKE